MRKALLKKPIGYQYAAQDYFRSNLGRALVFDHDVNAPGTVAKGLKIAIDILVERRVITNLDPSTWGEKGFEIEKDLIEIYGPSRLMNSSLKRYNHLKAIL